MPDCMVLARPVSLAPRYSAGIIDLGSIAGLHSHAHELHAYCSTCDRWSVLDLEGMVSDAHGERRLPIRVRC